MFQRYTEEARRVIFYARYEASNFGSPQITPLHILLGLVRQGKGLFLRLGLPETQSLHADCERLIPHNPKTSTSVDLPLSDTAEEVLRAAGVKGEEGGGRVGLPELLAGLLEAPETGPILRAHGITDAQVQETPDKSATESIEWSQVHEVLPERSIGFLCDGEIIGKADLEGGRLIPRIGEQIAIQEAGGWKAFRVMDVGYIYGSKAKSARRRLRMVVVTVKRVEEDSSNPAYAHYT